MLGTADRAYVAGTSSVNPTRYDSARRSVYLPVVRSAVYEVFQAFDFADPSVSTARRDATTVAPQALFMMNSPLMLGESRRWAENLVGDPSLNDRGRVQSIHLGALSRPATDAEVDRSLQFLKRHLSAQAAAGVDAKERNVKSWQALCRAVLSSNEFVYVE